MSSCEASFDSSKKRETTLQRRSRAHLWVCWYAPTSIDRTSCGVEHKQPPNLADKEKRRDRGL